MWTPLPGSAAYDLDFFQTAFRSEKPGRSGVQVAVMDQRQRTCPVLMSPGLALCARTTITAAGSHLPTWGKREEEKKITVLSGTRGQDFLSLSGVAHRSTADGLAASHLNAHPGILGVRNFCYPRAFPSQPQYRRVHKNVINSFSIGMVS